YGACCVDDFTAKSLEVDLLIHYGHSCLIPIDRTEGVRVLYIFVDIKIDPLHFIETIKINFPVTSCLALVSTIQFIATLQTICRHLIEYGYQINLPQSKPLSAGEILGCTAPNLKCSDIIIYLGDGRFHLEAIMISNPSKSYYRYDPYSKEFTEEHYDHKLMNHTRKTFIDQCETAGTFGIIMGTLGRQGNLNVVENIRLKLCNKNKKVVIILLSEIFPKKLELFPQIDAYVQIACPRLSIDWGPA
nr:putative diphthamide biosynthesis protein 1 [Cucujiformia]